MVGRMVRETKEEKGSAKGLEEKVKVGEALGRNKNPQIPKRSGIGRFERQRKERKRNFSRQRWFVMLLGLCCSHDLS